MTEPVRIATVANPSAEADLCASAMMDPRAVLAVELSPDHFSNRMAASIWETVLGMVRDGEEVNPTTVDEHLRQVGWDASNEIAAMLDNCPEQSDSSLHALAQIVRDCWRRRVARGIGQKLRQDCDPDEAMRALMALDDGQGDRWYYAPERLVGEAEHALTHVPEPGLTTGFERYDRVFGGLQRGELIVVAARPSVGKTAMVLNMACNSGSSCAVFSGEQSTRDVVRRMIASQANIPLSRLRVGGLIEDDRRKAAKAMQWFRQSQIHVIDRPSPTLTEVVRETRRLVHLHGIRLVVVDYLQRMRYELPRASREENVEHSVRGLKELARDLDIPVLIAAQVNRDVEKREDKVPTMADLLHSSAVEREADVVMTMYRERVYDPTSQSRVCNVSVRKNRSGPTGEFDLVYAEEYVRFENPERRAYPEAM